MLQEGSETTPRCDMCGMHMPVGRLIKYWRMACCFKRTEMRLRQKYVEVTSRYADMEFNLEGKEVEKTIEGVELCT